MTEHWKGPDIATLYDDHRPFRKPITICPNNARIIIEGIAHLERNTPLHVKLVRSWEPIVAKTISTAALLVRGVHYVRHGKHQTEGLAVEIYCLENPRIE